MKYKLTVADRFEHVLCRVHCRRDAFYTPGARDSTGMETIQVYSTCVINMTPF